MAEPLLNQIPIKFLFFEKRPVPDADWPESWRVSYAHDLVEIYGEKPGSGYCYSYTNRFRIALETVQRYARPGARVFDIAAAQGNYSLALAELGYDVTWNDIREDLVPYVRQKHVQGSLHFSPGNILEQEVREPFDCVFLGEVIEHAAHPDQFLAVALRFLKKDGVMIMTTPNGGYFRESRPRFSEFASPGIFEKDQFRPDADGHIFLLHLDELYSLGAKTGARTQECRLFNNPLTSGHMKSGFLLKALPAGVVMAFEKATQNMPLRVQQKINTSFIVVYRKQP